MNTAGKYKHRHRRHKVRIFILLATKLKELLASRSHLDHFRSVCALEKREGYQRFAGRERDVYNLLQISW